MAEYDPVNHPKHYNSHPSGIEAIVITRHMTFNIGNVIKYCWRAGLKDVASDGTDTKELEDLKKAAWYLNDEIERLSRGGKICVCNQGRLLCTCGGVKK